MKRSLMRAVRMLVAAPLLVALAAGSAYAADAPDAWLTMKTSIALMTADGVSTSDLNVDTVMGVVTLHGKVPTEGEKAKAEATARRVDGVKDVKNLLQVVPDSAKKAVERSDDVQNDVTTTTQRFVMAPSQAAVENTPRVMIGPGLTVSARRVLRLRLFKTTDTDTPVSLRVTATGDASRGR